MTTAPLLTVDCWLVDVRGASEEQTAAWDAAEPEQRERAARLATFALRGLTGDVVEPCVRVARPCARPCTPSTWRTYPVYGTARNDTGFSPRLDSGSWINIRCGGCGSSTCGHTLASIRLDGATEVLSVWVGGLELPEDAYALRGSRLARLDGEVWPRCQNLDATRQEADSFEVRYYAGRPGAAGEQAAGRLAVEYLAAITGGSCALPASVTSVVRAGVSITKTAGAFPGGLTGVREVDAWVSLINPDRLTAPSQVLSPDMMHH